MIQARMRIRLEDNVKKYLDENGLLDESKSINPGQRIRKNIQDSYKSRSVKRGKTR